MSSDTIIITSKIDDQVFRRFAVFDSIVHQKRWKLPSAFAVIMTVFAVITYIFRDRAEQSMLMIGVLLTIGYALPIVYFATFLSSVRTQTQKLNLAKPKHFYTVHMAKDKGGIVVADPQAANTVFCKWDDIHVIYRVKGCIYLYIAPQKAFLLPDGQANVSADEVWSFLTAHVAKKKLVSRI